MSLKAPTHHISAQPGEFAKTVIMPGDPLRAKFIAETFLDNAKLINEIRCMYAYTGTYKDKEVSVMAHGIGSPSMSTHAYELFELYDVEQIIRVGTAGGLHDSLKIGDVIIAMGASHNSSFADQYHLSGTFSPIADFDLMYKAVEKSEELGIEYKVGNILSSDIFYPDFPEDQLRWMGMGILGVEMEVAALYMTSARAGKKALGLLTVSDHIVRGENASAMDRQVAFTDMMKLALEIA